jgi:hypothetical protein
VGRAAVVEQPAVSDVVVVLPCVPAMTTIGAPEELLADDLGSEQ